MTQLSEAGIEQFAIEQLHKVGYTHLPGSHIAPSAPHAERTSYSDVFLLGRLEQAVARLNPSLPAAVRHAAVREIQRQHTPDLLTNNEAFHRLLTTGIPITTQRDGQERGELVWLIDFDQPEANDFAVVSQLRLVNQHTSKRLDLVLFVNGLPLVVLELKNGADEQATLHHAYKQLQTYKDQFPALFIPNALLVISDGLEARVGSLAAGFSRFMAWKSADGRNEASPLVSQLQTLIQGLLNPTTLLDMVRHFIVFEQGKREDPHTGLISLSLTKKVAAYHQYYAVNAAVASTLRAAAEVGEVLMARESPGRYGLPGTADQPKGDQKAGVVWHTQGSGKSLSMLFYAGKIILHLHNPTLVIITDRNDLDDQLFETFSAGKQLLRQEPIQAESREHLQSLLKVASGGVIFSTIQKFQPAEGNIYQTLTERRNVVIIADEAHRTHYGFAAKVVNERDAAGQVVGQKMVYGFAKYLRDALPKATFLGFTGTPIEKTDVNTPAVFGNYVDIYDIAQAVEDGATVRIYYESRLAKVGLSEEGKRLIAELDEELEEDELSETQKAKAKWTKMEALIGSNQRLHNIARDIVTHFEARQEVFAGKGMVVCMSRRIAAELYAAVVALRPAWHSDDLRQGEVKVVMTAVASDGPHMARHHTTKEQRQRLAERMKNDDDPLKLVIVRDMWLTGFDVPSLHTLYIDKPMRGHNLMQAIARVNRVHKDKQGGLVVDYLGIAADLQDALAFYADAGGKGDPTLAQEQAVALMQEKVEVVAAMFHGFPYRAYFSAGTAEKLGLILAAQAHILGLAEGRERFITAVTALSQAFAIAIPHEQAMAIKEEVGFFQAIKARLAQFAPAGNGRSDVELETTIRQVIDKALVSEQVVDIYSAAGIKKPDVSILSDEFLAELKGHTYPNVALEVLKKLLMDELKVRAKKNLVLSQSLLEMLESALRRYHNKIITAAEVIEELIHISKDVVAGDTEAHKLGLTDFEYAFYTAVAANNSARDLMSKEKLRELAVVLTQKVRENATIDWTIKENVRAKLKVIVKRTLRYYGYPPDMELLATETVLKQAEILAEELVGP